MSWLFLGALLLVLGFAAYVRLAPQDAERWRLTGPMAALGDHAEAGGFRAVRAYEGNWAAVEAVQRSTPRTQALGGWDDQRLYVTRSALRPFGAFLIIAQCGLLTAKSRSTGACGLANQT